MEGFKVSLFVLCLFMSFDFTEGDCTKDGKAGKYPFGQNCNYLCRCGDTTKACNQSTGECLPEKCQKNWMGPSCQYFHIARDTSDNTLDDDEASCNSISSSKTINLGSVYPFNSVTVVFSGSGTRVTVCIQHGSSGEWSSCVNTTETTATTTHAVFGNFVQAQYVRLDMHGTVLSICEIRINAGRNLAYRQAASQSSNWSDIEGVGTAMNAVDGSGGGETGGSDNNCIHTKDEVNPWWKVDLGSLYNILWFRVFNWRDSCCENNLVNFTLSLSNSSGRNDLVELFRDQRTSLPKATTESPILVSDIKILQGRYVHVTRPGTLNASLLLCEIHIFGECPDNSCGFTCKETCYCKVGSYVDKLKGLCFGGCQPGWTGDGYICNRTCIAGKYGDNCSQACGNCSIFPCNHVDGKCTDDKCDAGYRGNYCKLPCAAGTYGNNCMEKCGNCSFSPCNPVDGRCINDKCKPGYKGDYCKQPCVPGKYGDSCLQNCGMCSISPCNHVDGRCHNDKCGAGYRGPYCKQLCDNGTYGENCLLDCVACANGTMCDSKTGKCPNNRCEAGFQGETCKTDETQTDPKEQSTSTSAIAGAVIATVLVVICGVIGFVILRRRKRFCEKPIYEDTHRSNDEHQYYEIGNVHVQCTTGVKKETKEGIAAAKTQTYENTIPDTDNLDNSAHKKSILQERLRQLEQQKRMLLTNVDDVEQNLQQTKAEIAML